MRRWGLLAIIIVLLGALAYVNRGIAVNTGQSSVSATQAPQASPADQTETRQPPTHPGPPVADVQPPASVEVVGNPTTAQFHYTIGWDFNSTNQSHPQSLLAAIQAIQQDIHAQPNASAVIADIDVPPIDRPAVARSVTRLGVMLNGQPLDHLTGNPGEGAMTAQALQSELKPQDILR